MIFLGSNLVTSWLCVTVTVQTLGTMKAVVKLPYYRKLTLVYINVFEINAT